MLFPLQSVLSEEEGLARSEDEDELSREMEEMSSCGKGIGEVIVRRRKGRRGRRSMGKCIVDGELRRYKLGGIATKYDFSKDFVCVGK